MTTPTKLEKLATTRLGSLSTPKITVERVEDNGTTLRFSSALEDNAGVGIEHAIIGVKYITGNSQYYVENIYIPTGSLSTDKKTASNVVRGLGDNTMEYDVGDADFVGDSIPSGSIVEVVYSVQQQEMLLSAIHGEIATGGNTWTIGDGTDGDKYLKGFFNGSTVNLLQYQSDGTTLINVNGSMVDISSLASHGNTASINDHADVSISTVADGDHLVYNSTSGDFENVTPENNDYFASTYSGGSAGKVVVLDSNSKIDKSLCENVSNSAYSSGWDGVTDEAPSKNAVYDKISSIQTGVNSYMVSSSRGTSGTQTFYHGLGRTPSMVRAFRISGNDTGSTSFQSRIYDMEGVYAGGSVRSIVQGSYPGGVGASSTYFMQAVSDDGYSGDTHKIRCTISVNSSAIVLTWTAGASWSGNLYFSLYAIG